MEKSDLVLHCLPKRLLKYLADYFCCDSFTANLLQLCSDMYEGCSNMNASSFITFFTYMLLQNAIPFWKELLVTFKMAPNKKKHSLYFSSYRTLYKGHSCILKFFLKQIAVHVLVHVRIKCHIFVSFRQNGTKF